MAKINIIMASYQGAEYIEEQLSSLFKSDYDDFFLHVFDDGSTDGTIEKVLEFEGYYKDKLKLYQNTERLGHVSNFLNGLMTITSSNKDKSEYYMFCDQDDIWKKNKMSLFMNRMKKLEKKHGKEHPLLIFSDAHVVDKELGILHRSYHKSQKLNINKRSLPAMLMENKCSGCMMMLNTALAKKIKRLPTSARYHDWWLALIAAAFGHISYINSPLILYRQHDHNVVGNQSRLSYIKDRLMNVKKQKKALNEVILQAEEFLMTYKGELNKKNEDILVDFVCLSAYSWIKRRVILLKHGFFKSTFIRNVGVFLLI